VLRLASGLPLVVLFGLLGQAAGERTARAEEPKLDYADGPTACQAFDAKNERELAEWSKAQPAIPYQYPRDDNVLGAPWGPLTTGIGSTIDLMLASAIPHIGAQLRSETPAAVISWPWQIPFGPAFTCSRRQGTFTVRGFRSHRILLEPGVVASQRGIGVFARPGYRFIYHPSDWVVGAGGGLGSTIEISGNREPLRPSLSPEAVMQFGHCCEASYFTLAMRYDRFFGGETKNILWGSLGYTFF
jgi:hypothetical protein